MKKKEPDNLALDVRRAELLGYGPHYGRYKADYPHTREDQEQEPEPVPKGWERKICPTCQKEFYGKHNQVYCGEACRCQMNNKRMIERRKK